MTNPDMVRLLGVDPGSVTGIVCLELPAGSRDLAQARWLGPSRLNAPAKRKHETKPAAEARLFQLAVDALRPYHADITVLEDPTDGMPKWSGHARGTAYGLGRTYGLLLAAVHHANRINGNPNGELYAYPVAGTKKKPLAWMPKVRGGKNGNLVHTIASEDLVPLLKRYVQAIPIAHEHFPIGAASTEHLRRMVLTEHELMAFGVLRFHIERHGA